MTIFGIQPSGERVEIALSVGKPYLEDGGEFEQWRCVVALTPIHNKLVDAAGADAVQCLCLALSLALTRLGHLREDGWHLLNDDGSDISLESYSFGRAVATNGGAQPTLQADRPASGRSAA